jgi:glycosyltransferase involved in cell wall biosynthesis
MFSILIPTWNSLDYLKLCVSSIRKFSTCEHEILVHVNDGSDGTLDWVRAEKLKFTHSSQNAGVCIATNCLAGQATRDWLLYMNDDMGNPLVVVRDFGRGPRDFDLDGLLANYATPERADIYGEGAQPTLVHRTWWHAVGGYSLEFGPGLSSDDDLLMKLWVAGCRTFRVVGASRLYHFGCHSTNRVRRNHGGRTFVMKWGITQHEFKKHCLGSCRNGAEIENAAHSFPHSTPLGRLRRVAYTFRDYPLDDLSSWDPAPGRHLSIDVG